MNGLKSRIATRAMVVAFVFAGMFGVLAGPASALTNSPSTCAGGISTADHRAVGSKVYGPNYLTMTINGFDIYRSSCNSGDQVVTVTMREWVWNNSLNKWVLWYTPTLGTYNLKPGEYMPAQQWHGVQAYRSVSIDITFVWRTPGGAEIGRRYLDYNKVADYNCPSIWGGYAFCDVYSDPTVGAYMYWR